ncbi:MAG: gliding motility-associated C-terminal domain-containing protein [Lewinellaceae bacterium]|nr:gliding motility-associated C-terminal domain-containing protein [Lewinellaceae bacterium]
MWRIWDRWGNLVFSTTDPATSWNGMMGHRLAPLGVYVYSIRGRTAKGELNEQGTVTLVY